MNQNFQQWILPCVLLFASSLAPRAGAALVDMELSITPLIGSYHYDVTIRNNGPLDLTLVSIANAPLADPLIGPSLSAPAGFITSYDAGLGFIDFIEDTRVFATGVTATGFQFTSSFLPGTVFTRLEAIDVLGGTFSGAITVKGGPVGPVPDSGGSAALTIIGVAVTALVHRRGRRGTDADATI